MKPTVSFAIFITVAAGLGMARARGVEELVPERLRDDAKLVSIAVALEKGYGDAFGGVRTSGSGKVVFVFAGEEILYDDGKKKTFDEMLENPDLEDSFSIVYPLKNPTDSLPENFDPGRIRVEGMCKALYGHTEAEVAADCVKVSFCGHSVRFSKKCGAAAALQNVGKDLDEMMGKHPPLKSYVSSLGGTFSWRFIAGTKRLSNHSFANSIDLNVDKCTYWKWSSASTLKTFSRKDWPVEIIEIFEKHGFIWGGKWWHFDTMHFEFRPELIAHARAETK